MSQKIEHSADRRTGSLDAQHKPSSEIVATVSEQITVSGHQQADAYALQKQQQLYSQPLWKLTLGKATLGTLAVTATLAALVLGSVLPAGYTTTALVGFSAWAAAAVLLNLLFLGPSCTIVKSKKAKPWHRRKVRLGKPSPLTIREIVDSDGNVTVRVFSKHRKICCFELGDDQEHIAHQYLQIQQAVIQYNENLQFHYDQALTRHNITADGRVADLADLSVADFQGKLFEQESQEQFQQIKTSSNQALVKALKQSNSM